MEFMGVAVGILALICALVLLFGRSGTRKVLGWGIAVEIKSRAMTITKYLIAACLFSLLSGSAVNADTLVTYEFINTTAHFSFPGKPDVTIGITGTFTVDTSIPCACPAFKRRSRS